MKKEKTTSEPCFSLLDHKLTEWAMTSGSGDINDPKTKITIHYNIPKPK